MSRRTVGQNTYRFFVDPAAIQGNHVALDDQALAHQLGQVLRLTPGDSITLLDNSGQVFVVELTAIERRGRVTGQITAIESPTQAGLPQVYCYTGLMRSERYEWLLQKGTEIGVTAFTPVLCQRTIRGDAEAARKQGRWVRILQEAAEQSQRTRLPQLHPPQSFETTCRTLQADLRLLLWEGDGVPALHDVLRQALPDLPAQPVIALLSGPEGGISPEEYAIAEQHAIMPVTLGSRILRAETAPLVAATCVLYELRALG